MTTLDILNKIDNDVNGIKEVIKELAPQNSSYKGIFNWRPVNFIHVMGRRVFTNSGRLRNSISTKTISQGLNQVKLIYADGNQVPYYQKAVLQPTIQRVTLNKYGRTEYADDKGNIKLYGDDKITNITNRNYMFYKKEGKLETALRSMVTSYRGEVTVTDKKGEWV